MIRAANPIQHLTMLANEFGAEGRSEVRLEVTGRFDAPAAMELSRTLRQLDARTVVVDFSHALNLQDLAVAILAKAIKENVRLEGLGLHHERLLRYCGVRTPPRVEQRD